VRNDPQEFSEWLLYIVASVFVANTHLDILPITQNARA
jgi:hypothetical protein